MAAIYAIFVPRLSSHNFLVRKTSQKAGLLAAGYNINREYTFRRMGANLDPFTACRKIICFVSQNPGCRLQSLLNPCCPEILDPNDPSLSQIIFPGSPSASPTLHPPQRLGIEVNHPSTLPSAAQNSVERHSSAGNPAVHKCQRTERQSLIQPSDSRYHVEGPQQSASALVIGPMFRYAPCPMILWCSFLCIFGEADLSPSL
ncbi:hypothetical protein CCUS01_03801 [Colletotrichum cuscutae]|uniref:Uncharacterized protein n=1 Tax=Colletotrichum cuscutae TaxID=1209917 RepID=A0AAI9VEG9_9PEZI|nr:hypothetical protein CCUS01_03801 [Colletotrichum cuscutae]